MGVAQQDAKNSKFKWFCIFGGPIGFVIGLAYSGGVAGLTVLGGTDPGPPTTPDQFDHPPDSGSFGFVVRPKGALLPTFPSARHVDWPQFGGETVMTTSINGRGYSLMLGTPLNPFSRPPWLPSEDQTSGYRGRWGNRVTRDPEGRRAGMEFAEFWELFLLALRKAESLP